MAERLNRDPDYDLVRHIITGEKGPLSGSQTLRQFDAELDRNDPMEDITKVGETTGLQTQMQNEPGKEPVDLAVASNCFDEPSKGKLSYGPKNMGEDYSRNTGGNY